MSSAEVKMAYAEMAMASAFSGVFTCSSLSNPCGVCSSRKSEQEVKAAAAQQHTAPAARICLMLFVFIVVVFLEGNIQAESHVERYGIAEVGVLGIHAGEALALDGEEVLCGEVQA